MEGTIEKRLAVVTGGNKGIGFEICRQLASNGIRVVLTARDEKRGTEAVDKLNGYGLSDVIFHQLDVANPSSAATLANFIKTKFGKLEILVNNAGIFGQTVDMEILNASKPADHDDVDGDDIPDWMKKSFHETYEMAEDTIKTNFLGTKCVVEALLPLLQLSNSWRIVNVSSIIGQLKLIPNDSIKQELSEVDGLTEERLVELSNCFLKDFKGDLLETNGWPTVAAAYKVSKLLVNAYTRILAKKYHNVCINCVNPGFVKTDLNWSTGLYTTEEGARGPVMLALLPDGGPSGFFFDKTEVSTF